ncbi:DUF2807 domain-containing protein [Sphingomonas sp. CGMCC 1.13654]|uniref:DUF2807 domain-containing protein n=1 Tax=Sphingomonas chungangi TaxID=2683589 RepID=A0A838KZ06_9SPHN|nr:head GIN domain-containing protein [Sphingomonas chungangi]MBA2932503.1 DUF2807 domain-containing protein [Sphingomonas chungangi]
MSRIAILASLVALPIVAAPADAAMQNYGLSGFNRMRISGPFDVHVRVGGAPGAHATGPKEALDRLSIENNDGTLVIKALPGGWGGWPTGPHGNVVVEVSAPELVGMSITGSGDTTIDRVRGDALDLALSGSGSLDVGALDVTTLRAVMTGSGDMSLAGRARTTAATVTGSGDLKATSLITDDAQAKLVGSGDLSLGARHAVKVVLAGSGDVTIAGPAACAVTRTGSGDVRCAKEGTTD